MARLSSMLTRTGWRPPPDVEVETVSADALDAVVVPSGWAPDKLRRYDAVKDLVAEAYHQGKIVGLICHAGLVGISASIVDGNRATGSLGIKDDLVNVGATWVDEPHSATGTWCGAGWCPTSWISAASSSLRSR